MELPVLILPAILATFAAAFGVVWWYGSKPAFWWMLAYAAQGVGYLGEIVPTILHEGVSTLLVDTLFLVGFFAFGQAISLFFGWPRRVVLYAAFTVAACATVASQVFLAGSLKGELLAVDLGCGTLALLPLLLNLRRMPRSGTDQAVIVVTILSILNCYAVASLFAIFGDPSADFDTYMQSSYVVASYTMSTFLNLVVPLVQLAAVALRAIQDNRTDAEVDTLTGLLNRRGFHRAVQRGNGYGSGSVIVADIDHFRRVNDDLGHSGGDRVLVTFADAVRLHATDGGHAARFGGEEFVVFLPGIDADRAVELAREIGRTFRDRVAEHHGTAFPVTASFGVAKIGVPAEGLEAAMECADIALYRSKRAGRDRVAIHGAEEPSIVTGEAAPNKRVLRVVA